MSCGYAYAPSGEVLGHRGDVAKLNSNVVALQQHRAMLAGRWGKSKVGARSR